MQNRGSSFEKRVTLTIIVLFVNLVLISNSVILDNNRSVLENFVHSVITPFQIAWNGFTGFVSDRFSHYVFLRNNQKRLLELKKRNRDLWYDNYRLRKTIEKQGLCKISSLKEKKYILAHVISVNSGFPLSGVIIDRGILTGIHKGMVVLNEKMELVGKITNPVTLFSAKVQFITNPAGGTGAYINSNKLEGLLKGTNSEVCSFEYIIGNKRVDIGELVVTSGTDSIYPPYIKIGKVVKTEKKALIQKIYVKPFFINESISRLVIMEGE